MVWYNRIFRLVKFHTKRQTYLKFTTYTSTTHAQTERNLLSSRQIRSAQIHFLTPCYHFKRTLKYLRLGQKVFVSQFISKMLYILEYITSLVYLQEASQSLTGSRLRTIQSQGNEYSYISWASIPVAWLVNWAQWLGQSRARERLQIRLLPISPYLTKRSIYRFVLQTAVRTLEL